MLYLLDANVLITAKNQYYEFGRVDQYWEWLAFQAEQGNAKIPLEIFEEITRGKDELSEWEKSNKSYLVFQEEFDIELVRRVTAEGYAPNLTEDEFDAIGRDPFLIAYAFADRDNRMVVTGEKRSNKQRQNRPIPSVCDYLLSKAAISGLSAARSIFGQLGMPITVYSKRGGRDGIARSKYGKD